METFKEVNDRFMEQFEKMSEFEKNRIAGIENDRTPEEEAATEREALETIKRLEEKGTFKKLNEIIKYRETVV